MKEGGMRLGDGEMGEVGREGLGLGLRKDGAGMG